MSDFKTVLAFDTALNGCSVGLYEQNAGRKSIAKSMTAGQSEALIPLIQDIVGDFQKLDAIAVTVGPGAFTGIRIGLSAAKAFGLALDIPVFGVTTMQALALTHANKDEFAVLIDTKRKDFYFQAFGKNAGPMTEVRVASAIEAEQIRKEYKTCVENELPDCGLIAEILANNSGSNFFTRDLKSLYLREADTSVSKQAARTLAS